MITDHLLPIAVTFYGHSQLLIFNITKIVDACCQSGLLIIDNTVNLVGVLFLCTLWYQTNGNINFCRTTQVW